jgi:hypothetical protein
MFIGSKRHVNRSMKNMDIMPWLQGRLQGVRFGQNGLVGARLDRV